MTINSLVYTENRSLSGWRKKHDVFRFYFWWWVNHCYCKLLFRLDHKGEEHLPAQGAAIVASNHLSFLDANLILSVSPRKIAFMIAREFYEAGYLRWMCEFLGCIPVNRSATEIHAVKEALRKLKQGHLLGAFPEGGISKSGEIKETKTGVAMLALRTGVPVVPVHLSGYGCDTMLRTFLRPKKIRLRVGEPLVFNGEDYRDKESLERVNDKIIAAIRDLAEKE